MFLCAAGEAEKFTRAVCSGETALLGNGIASTFTYDLEGQLTGIRHAKDAADLFKVLYGWDAWGNPRYQRDLTRGYGDRGELYAPDYARLPEGHR